MVKTETRIIDGEQVAVTMLPATQGLQLLGRVVRLMGPGLAQALAVPGALKRMMQMDPADLLGSFGAFAEKVTPETVDDLKQTLLAGVTVGGVAVLDGTFDLRFQGRLLFLLKVARFSLEVNLRDFFGVLFAARPPSAAGNAPPPSAGSST